MTIRHLAAWGMAFALLAAPALAQQRMIQVSVNNAEIIPLDRNPGSVLVANPSIADVVVEGGKHLFVLGKTPGETQLYVMDGNGGTMIRAVVAVVPQSARHMTVFRGTEDESQLHCAPRCAPTGGNNKRGTPAAPAMPTSAPPAAAPAAPPPAK
jgi:hypothetical protein